VKNTTHLSNKLPYCLKGTRVELLELIETWEEDENAMPVYWLNGHAGSRKTMLAQTFAKRMFGDTKLGASFFCSHASPDHSELKFIFLTLLFQLSCKFELTLSESSEYVQISDQNPCTGCKIQYIN